MVHLVADPLCYILGGGIKGEKFIEIAMVKIAMYMFLDRGEVDNHAVGIQFTGLAMDGYNPVVTVQITAFAGIGEV